MSAPRSTRPIVAAILLAVFGALVPPSAAWLGSSGETGERIAGGGCCCSGVVAADVCCCASDGVCSDPARADGPNLVAGCCGSGGGADLALVSGVRFLAAPAGVVRLCLPRSRTWPSDEASRPHDAGCDTPSPVPRVADVARA